MKSFTFLYKSLLTIGIIAGCALFAASVYAQNPFQQFDPNMEGGSTTPNSVTVQPGATTVDPNATCLDGDGKPIAGCYKVYEGLAQILEKTGNKFSVITDADSLGGFLNGVIAVIIGLAGVAAVVMIMWHGVSYMKSDNVSFKEKTRGKILKTLMGLLLLLTMYTGLRTINPDLLNLVPRIDGIDLNAINRSNDAAFVNDIQSTDTSNITVTPGDYNDPAFLAYLSHQQGAAGAASILWAANQGMSSVPNKTPFVSKNGNLINGNMDNNYYETGMPTPKVFLEYWRKKVEAKKTAPQIPATIDDALKQAAQDASFDLAVLRTICRIESYGCTKPNAVNGSYSGLFQMGPTEFQQYGKGGNIFDPYSNAYAGAKYAKYNINKINGWWSKINQ